MEGTTDMNKGSNIFGQILKIIDRNDFHKTVANYSSDKYSKGFNSWDHFVSMIFCQLAMAKSLREICDGLRSCAGKVGHLGMFRLPTKSNLSYVNSHRSHEFFEALFYQLLTKMQVERFPRKKKFRFKNKLYSYDATTIDLCLSMFDWAHYRKTKGAVKLHLLLDHDGYLPTFANITDGKTHEVNIARELKLAPGSIIALDRGYNDYSLFNDWTEGGVWFVTRMKTNATYDVVETHQIPAIKNIISDETIQFTGYVAKKECPVSLRKVVVWDDLNNKEIILLTNNMKLAASTISAIYKDRWEIELFFKVIKQNLRIKTFIGTSANAVKIQIWTALIAILLLKYLKFKSKLRWAVSNLVALIRLNLFVYTDLLSWLDNPFNLAREPAETIQLTLFD